MNVRTQIRGLVAATMLGLAIVMLPSNIAHAMPKSPVDNGVRCGYFNRDLGEWVYVFPGDRIDLPDKDGHYHTLVCDSSGHWQVENLRPAPPATNQVSTNATVAQP